MDCVGLRTKLHQFLDGDLPSDELESLEAHLARCRKCQLLVEGVREEEHRLRAPELDGAPAGDFVERTVARVRAWQRRRHRDRAIGFGLAAGLVIAIVWPVTRHLREVARVWVVSEVAGKVQRRAGGSSVWQDITAGAAAIGIQRYR